MLLGSGSASSSRAAQLDGLGTLLRELDRPFEHDVSINEPAWVAMRRIAMFLYEALRTAGTQPVHLGEAVTADSV
jgi:hypothetical protein